MSAITQGIYNLLNADTTLTNDLATYENKAAIFTTRPVPADTGMPYVVLDGSIAQEPDDTKTTRGRESFLDIFAYGESTGSAVVIERISERIRALLHRQSSNITITGFSVLHSNVSGPITAPTDDEYYGRVVTVRLMILEN